MVLYYKDHLLIEVETLCFVRWQRDGYMFDSIKPFFYLVTALITIAAYLQEINSV